MFLMNSMTPLISDDYLSVFVLPDSFVQNGFYSDNMVRLTGIQDFIKNTKSYYLNWGGRVPGSIPVGVSVLLGKEFFNPINAFMMIALIAEIYWLSHEGKIALHFKSSYIIWIFFSLWSFNIVFFDTFLWIGGSCNYLWMLVVVLAFLLPYVRDCHSDGRIKMNGFQCLGMFIGGILAGWSHETTTCWIILVLFSWLFLCKKNDRLQTWKITGFVGLCIGYGLLILAPGNYNRFQLEHHQSTLLAGEFIPLKLAETAFIICVHFLLWYFLLSFFVRHSKKFKQELAKPYFAIAKACAFIAVGSVFLMSLFTASGMRPSFLSLVFLTIGVTSLFRLQEITQTYVIADSARSLFKTLGYGYMIITIAVSSYLNILNWNQFNNILAIVNGAKSMNNNEVLQIIILNDKNSSYWHIASGFFHQIGLPITENEDYYNNKTFSKYYGIRGIKLIRCCK